MKEMTPVQCIIHDAAVRGIARGLAGWRDAMTYTETVLLIKRHYPKWHLPSEN